MEQSLPVNRVDARFAQGVQIGDHATQINYFERRTEAEGPIRVGVVPHRAACFQKRSAITPPRPGSIVVLTGLGGVGKTQAAVSITEELWAGGDIDLMVWISAVSRPAILAAYAQATRELGLDHHDNVEADAARFHAWLAATDHRWLVILDNLNHAADLTNWWPPVTATGRTLVTTRRRDAALRGDTVSVDVFGAREAEQYVRARLVEHSALADDPGVVHDLQLLPLALAQATAFMIDENVPCSAYRQRLADRRERLDDLVPEPNNLPDDYDRTVATTLWLSVEVADRSRPAGLAAPLLELASVLDSTGIPASLFTTTAVQTWLPDESTSELVVRSGLRTLHRLNLITEDAGRVAVHALVQRAIRERLTPDQIAAVARTAADAVLEMWPTSDKDPLAAMLRANTAALVDATGDALVEAEHNLLFRALTSLGNTGLVEPAAVAFAELMATTRRIHGPDHPSTLSCRHEAARWHGIAGHPAEALDAFERLLPDRRRVSGADHQHTLTVRHEIAYWRAEIGDLSGAIVELSALCSDRARVLGADHHETLVTRSSLARVRGRSGEAAGAQAAFERLLPDMRRVLGPEHVDTLTTRHEIASWRGQNGDAVGAVAAFERLLADLERIQGPNHVNTLAARNGLAYFRGQAGDAAGAVAALETMLPEMDRTYGPRHPNTLVARGTLAFYRGQAGDPAAAVADFTDILSALEQSVGPDDPRTLTVRLNLARWRGEAGDAAGAQAALSAVIARMSGVLGPGNPETLKARVYHGWWRARAGDIIGGTAELDEVIRDLERDLGADHPNTVTARDYRLRISGTEPA